MVFLIPQFKVVFEDKAWIVNADELDTLCKILRWNGITDYHVMSHSEFNFTVEDDSQDTKGEL